MKHERRLFTMDELRVAADGKRTISGHAAVFNRNSEPMWGFVERVAPGAFSESIGTDDVRALFNHDPNIVLGRNTAKTLRLSEDATGLAVEIDPPDTQAARDLLVSMERGDVTQMSFGFSVITDDWATVDEQTMRTLRKVRLYDVSPVTFAAYPDTDVSVRSLEEIAAEGKTRLQIPPSTRSSIPQLRQRLDFIDRVGA
jgi:HK97 family phage prohead protease